MLSWMMMMLLFQGVIGARVFESSNTSDPAGRYLWLAHGRCPGQPSPAGITAEVLIVDPFVLDGFAAIVSPLLPIYTSADGYQINSAGQDRYCNASVWMQQIAPPGYSVQGRWGFMSSFPWNMCGHGFAAGPWKGDPSLWIKTLEAAGPVGVSIFFQTAPSRYAVFPESCKDVSIPVTSTSFDYFAATADTIMFQAYFATLAFYDATGALHTIDVDKEEEAGTPIMFDAMVVGFIAAIICICTSILAADTLRKLKSFASFAAVILLFECLASLPRATINIIAHPPVGPYFYTGGGFITNNFFWGIMKPLSVPSTVLTSLVWMKFTLFRKAPPVGIDVQWEF